MIDRERSVVKHLSEGELDRLQAEADKINEYKRLTFLKRLYDGSCCRRCWYLTSHSK